MLGYKFLKFFILIKIIIKKIIYKIIGFQKAETFDKLNENGCISANFYNMQQYIE